MVKSKAGTLLNPKKKLGVADKKKSGREGKNQRVEEKGEEKTQKGGLSGCKKPVKGG